MRKGISLPIEMIIIISISVIVLLAAVSFFLSGLVGGQHSISESDITNRACALIRNRGCTLGDDLSSIEVPRANMTLSEACVQYMGATDDDDCIRNCCEQLGIAVNEPSDMGR